MSKEQSAGMYPSVTASERRMAKYKEERRRQLASQIANRLSSNQSSSSSDENDDTNSSLEKYSKYRRHHRAKQVIPPQQPLDHESSGRTSKMSLLVAASLLNAFSFLFLQDLQLLPEEDEEDPLPMHHLPEVQAKAKTASLPMTLTARTTTGLTVKTLQNIFIIKLALTKWSE